MTDDNKKDQIPYIDPGSLIDFSYFDRMPDDVFQNFFIDWFNGGCLIGYYWADDIIVSKIMLPTENKDTD